MSESIMRNIDSYHRKGSVYVLVLSVAMLVTGVGLSSLGLMRVKRRVADVGAAEVKARVAAGSLLEVALLRLGNDPTWRSTYTHDAWTTDESVDDITYAFKLVDEHDGDLVNDATQPVRLYAKATVGDAVRIYSVLLRSIEDETYADTVPSNGGMESGVSPWMGMGCELEIRTDEPHGGAAYLKVKSRDGPWDGPRQDIADDITEGVTYQAEVWVKLKDTSEDVRLVLWMDTSLLYYPVYYAQASAGTSWTQVTGTVTPTWTGELQAAYWEVETLLTSQELMIDDAFMRPVGSNFDMFLDPGTRRREVLP